MGNWISTIEKIAPTVATALGGPLAGVAVTALGSIFGSEDATTDTLAKIVTDAKLTPEHIFELQRLEQQYQENEKQRGFKYQELVFSDRDSARKYNTQSGIQTNLFYLSLLLIAACLGCEIAVLFYGCPTTVPSILVGRILGLMDSITMLVLSYYYGTSASSDRKTDLLSGKKA